MQYAKLSGWSCLNQLIFWPADSSCEGKQLKCLDHDHQVLPRQADRRVARASLAAKMILVTYKFDVHPQLGHQARPRCQPASYAVGGGRRRIR